jgi:hypothetical protein
MLYSIPFDCFCPSPFWITFSCLFSHLVIFFTCFFVVLEMGPRVSCTKWAVYHWATSPAQFHLLMDTFWFFVLILITHVFGFISIAWFYDFYICKFSVILNSLFSFELIFLFFLFQIWFLSLTLYPISYFLIFSVVFEW